MDGPREHSVKWNKPVKEKQVPYYFTHVESNEQTELTSKTEIDSYTEGRWHLKEGAMVGGVEGLNKKEEGLMDMDNSVVIKGEI